jgi:hypothetical protein
VSWTKLGAEFPDEIGPLSDAAFRTHVEALCWSNRRLLDLVIPKRDVRRFAETADPESAVAELVVADWWADRGDCWYIGQRFPDWQRDRSQVMHRRRQLAAAQLRRRRHQADDHSLCLTANCARARAAAASADDSTDDSRDDPERNGTEQNGLDESTGGESVWPAVRPPGSGLGSSRLDDDVWPRQAAGYDRS